MNDFRDTRLFELTAPVAEIEVSGTNHFILQERGGTNHWSIVGEKYPADAATVQQFIQALAGLRITEFVNDVPTPAELPAYGLDKPRREIILRSKAGDTNSVIADLQFGAAQTNRVFVQCGDENFIYTIAAADFDRLPDEDWRFRDRQIWNFKADDVAEVTIRKGTNTCQLVQSAPGKWSLAAGSQGFFIESKNIEQAVQMFQQFSALAWLPHGYAGPEYGFDANSLQITFDLKNGEKDTVSFGATFPQYQTALAAVTLDGERWAFVSPPAPYQLVLSYLPIPPNGP